MSSDKNIRLLSSAEANDGSESAGFTSLADLRQHTRVDASILAEAFTESGEKTICLIVDISLAGLRLYGDRPMVDILLPTSDDLNQDIPAPVRICLILPSDSTSTSTVKVNCRAVYSRHAAKDTYHVGMQFIDFVEGLNQFTEYLDSRGAI